ncbi:hypothetical protein B0H16DRAFT_1542168, partial [Mycena metata]
SPLPFVQFRWLLLTCKYWVSAAPEHPVQPNIKLRADSKLQTPLLSALGGINSAPAAFQLQPGNVPLDQSVHCYSPWFLPSQR